MPYGYYQLVRYLGMIAFVWLAYLAKDAADKKLYYFWFTSAILINPIFKISLGRPIWNFFDVFWAIILTITIIIDIKHTIDKESN
jgi:hypothetical protein